MRGAVERRRVGALRSQALERVGARLDVIEVLALERDGDQNVTNLQRVALHLVDADQVIAEPRRHGRRDLTRLEAPQALHELWDEARLVLLDPAQIATALAAVGVARFAARDVLELRAMHQLVPHPCDVRPSHRAVGGVRQARLGDEPHVRDGRALEVIRVLRDVGRQLGVADRAGVRNRIGPDRERGDTHRVVLVTIDPPKLGVGNVDVAREILLQLDQWNLLAVNRLELREQIAVGRRRDELLPFADIELAVGLELRIAHHLGRRGRPRGLDDLLVAHTNAEPLVLLLEKRVLDHLVNDMILDLLVFFFRDRGAPVLLPILFRGDLHAPLVFRDLELPAVDAEHHIAAGAEDAHHLSDGEPCHKGDGEDVKDPFGIGAHGAQHGDSEFRSNEG